MTLLTTEKVTKGVNPQEHNQVNFKKHPHSFEWHNCTITSAGGECDARPGGPLSVSLELSFAVGFTVQGFASKFCLQECLQADAGFQTLPYKNFKGFGHLSALLITGQGPECAGTSQL